MTWTIDTQITGRDWPLSLGFKGGTLPAGTRSETGQRWLGLVARVQVGSCGCKGGVLNQAGSARLFVDGTPITAAATLSSTGDPGDPDDLGRAARVRRAGRCDRGDTPGWPARHARRAGEDQPRPGLTREVAAPRGFEPRFTDPKSAVLPLDEGAAAGLRGRSRALPGKKMERKTGLEPATLTLAR